MIGPVAGFIAHGAFWILLLIGWLQFWPKKTALFVLLWLAGYFGLPVVEYGYAGVRLNGGAFFMPFVAALDIVLVFLVFKRNIRLG